MFDLIAGLLPSALRAARAAAGISLSSTISANKPAGQSLAEFGAAVVLAGFIVSSAHAQFTANPLDQVTTNTTALTPIGNGFGVALLGYGMPEYNAPPASSSSNFLLFATTAGQPSASDATVSNGFYQFYVVCTDSDTSGDSAHRHTDFCAYKVSAPLSDPGNLTILRNWIARIETNNLSAPQAGSFAACGVTKSGALTLRADGNQSPSGNWAQQGIFVFNADSLGPVVITNLLDPSCLFTNNGDSGATVSIGSMGRNQGLMSGSTFGNTQYVARGDIPTNTALLMHAQLIALDISRGAHSLNDTARVLAYWKRPQDEQAFGTSSDVCTHLAVWYYNDSGGAITLDTSRGGGTGSNEWAFGTRTGNDLANDHINTNAIDFFGATAFNGPAQISINDNGEMAFPISINCFVGNMYSNGTRSATITGILFKDANTGTFRRVVDNTDTSLFAPAIIPGAGEFWPETNNLVSPPVLDNEGNVFFEAGLTNMAVAGTNYQYVALYQSVPNQYPNPTGWTTRILLHEGDAFVEPSSGHTNRIMMLPLSTGAGAGRANVPRSLGANSINRTPVPGSANALGGVVICATLTNLTAQTRYDGLLYIAPLAGSADAGTNSWSSSSSGKWETHDNWSLGLAPSTNQSAVLLTNANSKTVTIDAATTNSLATLTISNLTVSTPLSSTNTLFLNNAGTLFNPLLILNSVTVGSGGVISVTNASLQMDAVGSVSGIDGVVVGVSGAGRQLNISGGLVSANFGYMGYNSSSSNNSVLVSGIGSIWSNKVNLFVGYSGAGNALIITNGGKVYDVSGYLGELSSNNTVLVSGNGSVWSNIGLYLGYSGAGNALTISNGGAVYGGFDYLGYNSSSSNNTVLVSGAGSVWSNGLGYVGYSGAGNALTISNGGAVYGGFDYLGYNSSSSNNSVLVSGAGSVWSNGFGYVGYSGARNALTISNGGAAYGAYGWLGYNSSSSNNTVLVTGSGSVWSNSICLYVGDSGAGNALTISNGGAAYDASGWLGFSASGSNNTVLVSGNGSVWSNSSGLLVGEEGSGNALIITNGGVVYGAYGYIGELSSSNTVLVIGNGALWQNQGNLYVGSSGSTNQLTVGTGGSVLASNVYVGLNAGPIGNQIFVNGGALYVTNALGSGMLDVRPGTLIFNGGTVTVDQLLANAVSFNNGVLNTKATFVTNATAFVVGDGASPANFHLLAGDHSFASGLRIRAGASLTGCGTVTGNVVVDAGGAVLADCGSTLDFSGTVTNNGNLAAVNGTLINFYGPVVNSGTINGVNGGVHFYSTLQNNGTVMGAANSWVDGNGKWETAANWWLGSAPSTNDAANLITNAGNNTVTIDTTTAGSHPGTMTINNLTVSAPSGATNTLFLNNAGTTTPLQVLRVLMLETNGAMVVNNSAVQATESISIGDSSSSSSLVVSNGGSLIVTNGGGTASVVVNGGSLILGDGTFKTDHLVVTNGGAVQHTQTYQVDNATVTVAGGSEQVGSNLVAGTSANSTGIVTVTDGGLLIVTNGVLGIGNNGTLGGGSGVGQMTVSNGSLLASTILLGSSVGGQGTLILAAGGLITSAGTNSALVVNAFRQDAGVVGWTNIDDTLYCGWVHSGEYILSDGSCACYDVYVGFDDVGTMTIAGGAMTILSHLTVGHLGSPPSAGAVWVTGGQLTITSLPAIIGNSGSGQMTISNGLVTAGDLVVANSDNPGTLTLAGGTLTVNGIVLPNPSSRFIFSGGWLNTKAITNANGRTTTAGNGSTSAMLDLLGGVSSFDNALTISTIATLSGVGTVSGGTINYGLVYPGSGTLNFTGGSFTNYGTVVAPAGGTINFNGPVVNNGLIVTNSAVHFNADLFNNGTLLDAAADSDGDGMNNTQEALAGTNPLNGTSVFRILSIAREGNGLRVTWSTAGGKRYVVQTSPAGNYANSFADLSSTISASGISESTTSYLDPGAATGSPTRYYRVRLAP